MEATSIDLGSGLVAVCEDAAPPVARELINEGRGMLADWFIARGERLPSADAAAVALVAAQLIALARSGQRGLNAHLPSRKGWEQAQGKAMSGIEMDKGAFAAIIRGHQGLPITDAKADAIARALETCQDDAEFLATTLSVLRLLADRVEQSAGDGLLPE